MNYWWSGDIICCYSHLPFLCYSCSFNWIIISITFVSAFSICRLQCQCSWLRFRSSASNVGPFHYYLLLHNLFVFVGFILCISYSDLIYVLCCIFPSLVSCIHYSFVVHRTYAFCCSNYPFSCFLRFVAFF